jgi:hypothetical protein
MEELSWLLDDARADEQGRARRRERFLRQAAEEGATFVGLLLDLAERGGAVRIRTASGRTHVGPIAVVGRDFVAVADALVRLTAVTAVREDVATVGRAPTGERQPLDLTFLDALARLAPERVRVALVTNGHELVAGELRSVGLDVVALATDGADGGLVYVPGVSVLEVLRSG